MPVTIPHVMTVSVRGAKHRRAGTAGQDAVASGSTDHITVIASSDGLGSCAHSEHGSRAAVDAIVATVLREHRPQMRLQELVPPMLLAAREAIIEKAAEIGCPPGQADCTANVLLIDCADVLLATVGDGVHAVRYADGRVHLVGMDTGKEFVAMTDTLLGDIPKTTRVKEFRVDDLDAIISGSDGLDEMLWTGSFARPTPKRGNIHHFLDNIRLGGWDEKDFETFLGGDGGEQFTTDDITLAVVNVRGENKGAAITLEGGKQVNLAGKVRWSDGTRAHTCSQASGLMLVDVPRSIDANALHRACRKRPLSNETSHGFAWPLAYALEPVPRVLVRPWAGPAASGPGVPQKIEMIVDALHKAGYTHGSLKDDHFAHDAYGYVQLRDCVTPVAYAASDEARERDLAYVQHRLIGGAP